MTLARDVMTGKVVSVDEDTPVRDIAAVLLDNHIGAVPVTDRAGAPVGMVSEGDLIGRDEQDRLARSAWWLALVAGRQPFDDAFRARLLASGATARDLMSSPLVTVTEDTDIHEIARLFAIHRIKRVPVVRDGHLVGIVSRDNLLQAIAAEPPQPGTTHPEAHRGFLRSLFGDYHLPAWETVEGIRASIPAAAHAESPVAADDFRHLAQDFHTGEMRHREDARRAAAAQRRAQAKELIDTHLLDDGWRQLMHRAREAAENGQREVMLLQFPSQVCTDGGRAINIGEKDWPATLRGRPAEIYLRWERDLKPRGFGLSAQMLDFPGGKPGDIGLFLTWGE